MLMVSGSLPQTSDEIPIIGIYFLSIIVEIALCLFATCLTAKICAKNTKMPCWLEALVNERLARFLFVKSKDIIKRRHDNGNLAVVQYDSFTRHVDDNRSVPEITNEPDSNQGEVELLEIGFSSNAQEETGDQLFSEVRLLADEARLKMSREGLAMKWQLAAKVLDRLFLCVFFIIYVILTSYLLSSM